MRLKHEYTQLLEVVTEQIISKFPGEVDGQTKYEIAIQLKEVFELGIEKGHHEALTNLISNVEKTKQQHEEEVESIFEKYTRKD